MIACDRFCCICRRADAQQIHHLNENRDDNSYSNLAALCLECHRQTQLTGGFGRQLRASEVRRCRDEWIESVRRRKEHGLPRTDLTSEAEFAAMVDAVAVVRIRELRLDVRNGNNIDKLYVFTRDFGTRVAYEALQVLGEAVPNVDSEERVRTICSLVRALLPFYSLVGARRVPLNTEERQLVALAQDIGFEIAYQTARRTHDLAILNGGGMLLWAVLRFAELNGETAIHRESLGKLEMLAGWCEKTAFSDGTRWVRFLIEDATQPREFRGVFPKDIHTKMMAAQSSARSE